MGIIFGTSFGLPNNAYAACVNTIQAQTIAAAYNGDQTPTVHHMDTCSGDDVSYQIPIATNIVFDGRTYENVYATTNSVITFGRPDGTFWDYPSTPSISLYSMDWYPGVSGTSGLDIYYSEGGFQMNLNMVPFGNYSAQPSTVNIVVAITNTGGISVAYSYQGPQYANMRTGVRLHNGQIVSLEAWGATQVQPGSSLSLPSEPISGSIIAPSVTPEQQQVQIIQAARLANEIAELNNLIALINDDNSKEEDLTPPEPTPEPTSEPTPEDNSESDSSDSDTPNPDVVVDPEIITPDDPRFPNDEEQNEQDDSSQSSDSDTTDGETEDPTPNPETSVKPTPEPSPQPTDKDPTPTPEPSPTPEVTPEPTESQTPDVIPSPTPEPSLTDDDLTPSPDNSNTGNGSSPISEEELNKLHKLIGINDAKLALELSNMLVKLSIEDKKEVAEDLGIKPEEVEMLAEAMKDDLVLAIAVVEFSERLEENEESPMPYTIADAITEVQTEKLIEDPIGTLTSMFTEIDTEVLFSPSEWGKDMTDDQREKIQEIVVSVIIASNLISASMTRRIG